MPAPRVDASEREASIEYEGKTYKVKYLPVAAPVEVECRDEATVFKADHQTFYPWKYEFAKIKRMVVEIDGERLDPTSLTWLAIPPEFMQLLRNAVFPKTDSFRERVASVSEGKAN